MRSTGSKMNGRAAAELALRADEPGGRALRQEMLLLHAGIDAQLPGAARRVIHFTAARRGEGTSTIVRAYGQALAEAMGRSVLIVDANDANPDQHLHFGLAAEIGWDDVVVGREALQRAIYQTSHPNLSITPVGRSAAALANAFDGPAVANVFAQLRERFDTILVDSSPVLRPGAMAVAGKADGVVLVIEAERTRWPVVERARRTIETSGGAVLGVVLNKRRYPIPDALYRWL